MDDLTNTRMATLGYTITEGDPATLYHNGVRIACSVHAPNLWGIARRHFRASLISEPAVREAMKGLRK